MPQPFVLILQEPSTGARRAVQINGLPCTLGSAEGVKVRLRTEEGILACIEESEIEGPGHFRLRRFDAGETEETLRHGDVFTLGDVTIRFLAGTAASLRGSAGAREPLRPGAPASPQVEKAIAYLSRLDDLTRRLGELIPDIVDSRAPTASA